MEKIYRVKLNSKGMPNFSTAVEIDTDISKYSDKLWKNAYERGKADRPQGKWIYTNNPLRLDDEWECSRCGNTSFVKTNFCDRCGARMEGADDE